MNFVSTRGKAPPSTLRTALFQGLAPDGGLFMPERIPTLTPIVLDGLRGRGWQEVASTVTNGLFAEALPREAIDFITAEALDFPVPLVRLNDRIHLLELFRGPTLAFKDFGARFMARLFSHFRSASDPPMTVLTATSGDTGGAVAHAFHGLPGLRVVILFPDGKVSQRQERQFSTLGGNVTAVAVQGDFDDCQRMAKEAFADQARENGSGLTSANSINIGRFLPQATYFFQAWSRIQEAQENRADVLFSVPSGNFGNVAAGLFAKAMGMRGCSFLAATNENDSVPRLLRTGTLTQQPSIPTLSTAMDVGNPSNLDRILHLYDHDLDALRADLAGCRVTDAETEQCIRKVYRDTGYVLDPHSAVGFAALEKEMEGRPDVSGVVLATAHPAKFSEVVEPLLNRALPIPEELAGSLGKDRQVIPMEPNLNALREVLEH